MIFALDGLVSFEVEVISKAIVRVKLCILFLPQLRSGGFKPDGGPALSLRAKQHTVSFLSILTF